MGRDRGMEKRGGGGGRLVIGGNLGVCKKNSLHRKTETVISHVLSQLHHLKSWEKTFLPVSQFSQIFIFPLQTHISYHACPFLK